MLTLINFIFALAGIVLVYVSSSFVTSGWLEIFTDNYSWIKAGTFWALVAFGVLLIVVSMIGCCGAWSGHRNLLKFYMYFLVLALVAFVFIAVIGLISSGMANDWKSKPFPAADEEVAGAQNFNRIYCYSQSAYYCNSANVTEALELFFPNLKNGSLFNQIRGINQFCRTVGDQASVQELQPACDACAGTAQFKKYDAVYDWSIDECPLAANSVDSVNTQLRKLRIAEYCRTLLEDGELPIQEDDPYAICRIPVLEFWAQWSFILGLSAAILTALCGTLAIFVCISKDRSTFDQQEDEEYYGTTADSNSNGSDSNSNYGSTYTTDLNYGR